MGYVDRGGGREGKKSLRKNKKKIVEMVKKLHSTPAPIVNTGPVKSAPAPPLLEPKNPNSFIDAGANLVHRQFDTDCDRVIARAIQSGVEAMIVTTNNFDKTEAALNLAKSMPGVLYCAGGVHPDSVKRTNEKQFAQQIAQLRQWLASPEAVAVICGLDFSRDYSTHFGQEKFLQEQIELAIELGLPLILYTDSEASQRLSEILAKHRADVSNAMIFSFEGTEAELDMYLSLDMYIGVNGKICDPAPDGKGAALRAMLKKIPRDRLLVVSDSPYHTPQNISDDFIRETKNEPSNMPYVLDVITSAGEGKFGTTAKEVAAVLRQNAKNFYKLRDLSEAQEEEEEEEEEEGEGSEEGSEEGEEEEEEGKQKSVKKAPTKPTPKAKEEEKEKGANNNNKKKKKEAATPAPAPAPAPAPSAGKKKGKGGKKRGDSEEEEEEVEKPQLASKQQAAKQKKGKGRRQQQASDDEEPGEQEEAAKPSNKASNKRNEKKANKKGGKKQQSSEEEEEASEEELQPRSRKHQQRQQRGKQQRQKDEDDGDQQEDSDDEEEAVAAEMSTMKLSNTKSKANKKNNKSKQKQQQQQQEEEEEEDSDDADL